MQYIYSNSPMTDFMICPRAVLDREDLPDGAKILYMYLLDRARISMQNTEWSDETGKVYLIFSIESLSEYLHKGGTAVKRGLRYLDKAELIKRIHRGIGRPDRIYVLLPESIGPSETDRKESSRQTEKGLPDRPKRVLKTDRKRSTNYNNYNNNNYSYMEGESL